MKIKEIGIDELIGILSTLTTDTVSMEDLRDIMELHGEEVEYEDVEE